MIDSMNIVINIDVNIILFPIIYINIYYTSMSTL